MRWNSEMINDGPGRIDVKPVGLLSDGRGASCDAINLCRDSFKYKWASRNRTAIVTAHACNWIRIDFKLLLHFENILVNNYNDKGLKFMF